MERRLSPYLLLALVAAVTVGLLPIAFSPTSTSTAAPVRARQARYCDPDHSAHLFTQVCSTGGSPSHLCCEMILEVGRVGGVACLCAMADSPRINVYLGFEIVDVLATYSTCGGPLPVHAAVASRCAPGTFRTSSDVTSHNKGNTRAEVTESEEDNNDVGEEEEDVDEEDIPSKDRKHNHHRSGSTSLRGTRHQRGSSSSLKEKLENAGIIIGIILVSGAVVGAILYIACAQAGQRLERARRLLDIIGELLPQAAAIWRSTTNPRPTAPPASTSTTALGLPDRSTLQSGCGQLVQEAAGGDVKPAGRRETGS